MVTIDIKQAFLHIVIDEDWDATWFLFSEDVFNETKPPEVYRFLRALFGISNSLFLFAATVKHHLEKYPEIVNFLSKNVYVDDIIKNHKTID